ncbi:hypothetical protein KJZ99_00085 [bacterium]|nr:hypothetical protein [bacterium]
MKLHEYHGRSQRWSLLRWLYYRHYQTGYLFSPETAGTSELVNFQIDMDLGPTLTKPGFVCDQVLVQPRGLVLGRSLRQRNLRLIYFPNFWAEDSDDFVNPVEEVDRFVDTAGKELLSGVWIEYWDYHDLSSPRRVPAYDFRVKGVGVERVDGEEGARDYAMVVNLEIF